MFLLEKSLIEPISPLKVISLISHCGAGLETSSVRHYLLQESIISWLELDSYVY